MFQRLIALVAGFALLAASAFAADQKPLTEDDVRRFAATLPALHAFADELDKEGKKDRLDIDSKPKPDEEFKPYSKVVKALKAEHPADYAKLGSLVRPHGFSADEWGVYGDRIIVAWLALSLAEEDPRTLEMMDGMDKSMIDMLPPEMKDRLASTFVMMDTVKNAPEADKKAVAPVKPELDELMQDDR